MIKKILLSIALFTIIVSLTSCGGEGGGPSSEPGGVNPGIPSVVQLLPIQAVIQTNSIVYFKAKVLDGNGNPVPNVAVTFINISPIGTFLGPVNNSSGMPTGPANIMYTDYLGFATILLTSSSSGFVTVQAEVNIGAGQVRDKETIFFTSLDVLDLRPSLTLRVDAEGDGSWDEPSDFILLETTGDDMVLVEATVLNGIGLPEFFETVTFGADVPYKIGLDPSVACSDGTQTCEVIFPSGNVKTTDSSGKATVLVQVTPAVVRAIETLFNVTAVASNGAASLVTLFLKPVTIFSVVLTANPGVVEPEAESTITAFVTTNLSDVAPDGTAVVFSTAPTTTGTDPDPCGFVTPFGQTTNGAAESTFTAPPTQGSCTITGTANGVSGTVDVIVAMATDLTVQPPTQTVDGAVGDPAVVFTIFDGEPPYDVFSSDPLFPPVPTTVLASGGTFTVTVPAGTPATTVTYTIRDATGATVTATLVITGPGALDIEPDNYDLTDGASPQTFLFQVTGGAPNYTVTSSDPAVVFNDDGAGGGTAGDGIINGTEGGVWTLTTDGEFFTATVPANAVIADTTVTLQVTDSIGSAPVTATLTITN